MVCEVFHQVFKIREVDIVVPVYEEIPVILSQNQEVADFVRARVKVEFVVCLTVVQPDCQPERVVLGLTFPDYKSSWTLSYKSSLRFLSGDVRTEPDVFSLLDNLSFLCSLPILQTERNRVGVRCLRSVEVHGDFVA